MECVLIATVLFKTSLLYFYLQIQTLIWHIMCANNNLYNSCRTASEKCSELKLIPYLSSDKWTVLCAVHVGVEGNLKVLWREKYHWINAGDIFCHELQQAAVTIHFERCGLFVFLHTSFSAAWKGADVVYKIPAMLRCKVQVLDTIRWRKKEVYVTMSLPARSPVLVVLMFTEM